MRKEEKIEGIIGRLSTYESQSLHFCYKKTAK